MQHTAEGSRVRRETSGSGLWLPTFILARVLHSGGLRKLEPGGSALTEQRLDHWILH